jgi:hypothetical protein
VVDHSNHEVVTIAFVKHALDLFPRAEKLELGHQSAKRYRSVKSFGFLNNSNGQSSLNQRVVALKFRESLKGLLKELGALFRNLEGTLFKLNQLEKLAYRGTARHNELVFQVYLADKASTTRETNNGQHLGNFQDFLSNL